MSALAVSFSGARVSAGKIHLTPNQTPGAINIDISGGTGAKVVRITEKPSWADGDYAPTVTRHPDDGSSSVRRGFRSSRPCRRRRRPVRSASA